MTQCEAIIEALQALQALGGEADIREVEEWVNIKINVYSVRNGSFTVSKRGRF
ncbi:hypothetical protein [Bacillus sp. B-jedd]|uniref:hypothetical protein n=1 Tax=Bacillus sp. B-jedd TaxID=1476857 RepID=UPI0005156F1A|nr:hypothetical protein [Bacillus sp. B-jedd]CEG26369.1 hypothetical protein BN1002_01214 [Bacillus sp. B-jedd]